MTLIEFVEKYDFPGSVVLLEGKRVVYENDKQKLYEFGRGIANATQHIKFRSGNAEGADLLFAKGVASVDKNRIEVITPYSGHRKSENVAGSTIAIDTLPISDLTNAIEISSYNQAYRKMVDAYINDNENRSNQFSIKGAYILRDSLKVVGSDSIISPSVFGFFYVHMHNPRSGGTGHTMNVCNLKKVPFLDQRKWSEWLKEM
ncbi:MAG: hypothetical protein PHW19_04240 [Salinivirgaceae bacterium]|jgi:hypothetical protein|nr:hypothetical protein [Salinivirgaceae bacterium]